MPDSEFMKTIGQAGVTGLSQLIDDLNALKVLEPQPSIPSNASFKLISPDGVSFDPAFSIDNSGDATAVGNLILPNKIIHSGDTDTFIQFTPGFVNIFADGTKIVDFRLATPGITFRQTVNMLDPFQLRIPNLLAHEGDNDTRLSFTDDQIELSAGGLSMLTLTETAQDLITLGPGSGDVDIDFNGDMFLRGSDGNFGIGTGSPDAALHIGAGDLLLDNTQGILFEDSEGTNRTFFTIDGSDILFVGPTGSPAGTTTAIKFRPGSATKMSIDEGGDVGIGIETMLAILHIRGGATDRGYLAIETADGSILSGEVVSGIKFISGDSSTPAPTDKIVAKIEAIAEGNHFASSFDTGLAFFTTDGITVSEQMRIDEAGRVGIGVSTLLAQLHVDQPSTTAAIPVALFDQADVSEEMFEFVSTIGVGNAIEAVGAKTMTPTHFIKVTLPGGLTRYFEVGTIA